jgi:hypothetical protein
MNDLEVSRNYDFCHRTRHTYAGPSITARTGTGNHGAFLIHAGAAITGQLFLRRVDAQGQIAERGAQQHKQNDDSLNRFISSHLRKKMTRERVHSFEMLCESLRTYDTPNKFQVHREQTRFCRPIILIPDKGKEGSDGWGSLFRLLFH